MLSSLSSVIERRKFGFSNPVKTLFKGDFRDLCHEELRSNRDVLDQYFSFGALEKMFKSVGSGFLTIPEQKLFQVYLFLNWHHLFIEKKFEKVAGVRHAA